MHEENTFLTLTYNNNNLPNNGSLQPEHFKKFIKKLRKDLYPKQIRYFGCGEYGERLNRPHYHICIFGHEFIDKEILRQANYTKKNKIEKGDSHLYRSHHLETIWEKGYSTVGDISYESAGYVARYCTKKIGGNMAKAHYNGKHSEFALMSCMPGIGKTWIKKYRTSVYPKDYITIKGRKFQPPKYYDDHLKQVNFKEHRMLKKKRKEKGDKKRSQNYENSIRLMQKEYAKKQQTRALKRGLENGN